MHTPGISDHNSRGAAYAMAGNYRRALIEFTLAIRIKSREATAYYNRALVYRSLNNYQRALGDFARALELRPAYRLAYYQRGFTYYVCGEHHRALRDFGAVLALEPADIAALIGRSRVCIALEEYDQALLNLDRAIASNARQAGEQGAYTYRGQVYSVLGRHTDAVVDFAHALSLQPGDTPI